MNKFSQGKLSLDQIGSITKLIYSLINSNQRLLSNAIEVFW